MHQIKPWIIIIIQKDMYYSVTSNKISPHSTKHIPTHQAKMGILMAWNNRLLVNDCLISTLRCSILYNCIIQTIHVFITALCSNLFMIELLIWAYVHYPTSIRCSWPSGDISLPTEAAAPITSVSTIPMGKKRGGGLPVLIKAELFPFLVGTPQTDTTGTYVEN